MSGNCRDEIHVGDIGTRFRFQFLQRGEVLSVANADQLRVLFRRPDGTTFTRVAVFASDGSDGLVDYVTVKGDLDAAGDCWQAQAYTEEGDPVTQAHHSEIRSFEVKSNLLEIPDDLTPEAASVGVSAPSCGIIFS